MPMTALDNLIVNVSDLEQRRLRPAVCDASSRTGTPRQDTDRCKIMERTVDGHARGTEGVRQLRLGGYAIALGPCATINLGEHEALDSLVKRPLVVRPAGQLEGALAARRFLDRFQHTLDNSIALVQVLLP